MLDLVFHIYVSAFLVILPVFALLILSSGAARTELPFAQKATFLGGLTVLLGICAGIALHLSQRDVYNVPATLADPPFVLMALFGGAASLWALTRLTDTGRAITDATTDAEVIAFQIPRVMGAVFLLGWAFGTIPWQFALPAGLGDIWAGIAGWQAWKAARAGAPDARRLIVRANVIGMLDFVVAVLTGILTSPGFAHLMAHDTPNIINQHPLAMFPGYFVPLFLGFHLISLAKLRRSAGPRAVAA